MAKQYPRYMHHATLPSVLVNSEEEQLALGDEYKTTIMAAKRPMAEEPAVEGAQQENPEEVIDDLRQQVEELESQAAAVEAPAEEKPQPRWKKRR